MLRDNIYSFRGLWRGREAGGGVTITKYTSRICHVRDLSSPRSEMSNMITNILALAEYNIILSSEIITGIQSASAPSLCYNIDNYK